MRRRITAAALSLRTLRTLCTLCTLCIFDAGSPALGVETRVLAALAVPLPGQAARLDRGPRCSVDAPDSRDSQVVVLLNDGRSFQVRLGSGSIVLHPVEPCVQAQPDPRPDLFPGTRPQRGAGDVREVWLAEPTLRYRHDIFERSENAASVRALTAAGRELIYAAPPDAVIEDRLPRLVRARGADIVLTVQSTLQGGAAVLVLGVAGDRLHRVAASAPIGIPQRWLNPIGVADFDGDGSPEVAAVVTPHIGGWLTLYRREGERLSMVHREPGFSNHASGSDELRLAAIFDSNGDGVADLAVPGAERRTLRIVTFAGGQFRELQRVGHSAAINSAVIAADLDGDGRPDLVYALADGTLVVLTAKR